MGGDFRDGDAGKVFPGFGSIGICERARSAEAVDHLSRRRLYGEAVIEMPHIRAQLGQAYARLMGMKLYAYRALDYVHAASPGERRYLLYCAVQKAKVSTEGVKVMALLSECIGAKGFEADTFFEMALRDIQLIPSLEGSTHINLALAAQFMGRYFERSGAALTAPKSVVAGEAGAEENAYLFTAAQRRDQHDWICAVSRGVQAAGIDCECAAAGEAGEGVWPSFGTTRCRRGPTTRRLFCCGPIVSRSSRTRN